MSAALTSSVSVATPARGSRVARARPSPVMVGPVGLAAPMIVSPMMTVQHVRARASIRAAASSEEITYVMVKPDGVEVRGGAVPTEKGKCWEMYFMICFCIYIKVFFT